MGTNTNTAAGWRGARAGPVGARRVQHDQRVPDPEGRRVQAPAKQGAPPPLGARAALRRTRTCCLCRALHQRRQLPTKASKASKRPGWGWPDTACAVCAPHALCARRRTWSRTLSCSSCAWRTASTRRAGRRCVRVALTLGFIGPVVNWDAQSPIKRGPAVAQPHHRRGGALPRARRLMTVPPPAHVPVPPPAHVRVPPPAQYLSDAEFQLVFAMDRAAFASLPGWRKVALKKKVRACARQGGGGPVVVTVCTLTVSRHALRSRSGCVHVRTHAYMWATHAVCRCPCSRV